MQSRPCGCVKTGHTAPEAVSERAATMGSWRPAGFKQITARAKTAIFPKVETLTIAPTPATVTCSDAKLKRKHISSLFFHLDSNCFLLSWSHTHTHAHTHTHTHTYACGNFHACAFTRFQKPQQLGRAQIACSCHVRQRAGPALLQAEAETTGIWGRKKAVRRVRHCKKVGLEEWQLAGRATVPRVLYGIGPRMSLRQRTILSKSLPVPARVALTIHTFRTVEPQVVVLFGKRWEFGDNRKVWKAIVCQYAPPRVTVAPSNTARSLKSMRIR